MNSLTQSSGRMPEAFTFAGSLAEPLDTAVATSSGDIFKFTLLPFLQSDPFQFDNFKIKLFELAAIYLNVCARARIVIAVGKVAGHVSQQSNIVQNSFSLNVNLKGTTRVKTLLVDTYFNQLNIKKK